MSEQQSRPIGFSLEVTVGAPIEVVWEAMRQPDQVRRWHGWHAEELDGEIDMIFVDLATEPEPYVLSIGDGDRFELRETADGTVVRLTRPTREDVPAEWRDWYEDINEGWTSFLHQLKFALERHPGEARRTVFLSGSGAPARPLTEGLEDRPVLFTAENQRGVVLDDKGPGLAVVGETPARPGKDAGAMVIVTTYGQDDAEFAREVDAWSAWWREAFPDAAPATV